MSIWSVTYQQSVFTRNHSDEDFSEFLPTRWRQKSTGIDMEQNYVTVTLCICIGRLSVRPSVRQSVPTCDHSSKLCCRGPAATGYRSIAARLHHSPFHSRLETFFSADPPHRCLPFLLQNWLHGFPGLFTDTSELIRFYFLVFFFPPLFSWWFRAVH